MSPIRMARRWWAGMIKGRPVRLRLGRALSSPISFTWYFATDCCKTTWAALRYKVVPEKPCPRQRWWTFFTKQTTLVTVSEPSEGRTDRITLNKWFIRPRPAFLRTKSLNRVICFSITVERNSFWRLSSCLFWSSDLVEIHRTPR